MKETIKNLTKAFIGESQARNRYTFYSKIAKKEGYEQFAEIFLITADNKKEHASWLFKLINQLKEKSGEKMDEIVVEAAAPTTLGTTKENLKANAESSARNTQTRSVKGTVYLWNDPYGHSSALAMSANS